MIHTLDVADFLNLPCAIPVADVRTPAEFAHGHITGAHNIPLFSNQERVQVGTTYKQTGREEAILLGFDLTGAKWSGFIKSALALAPEKRIALHCWRGGMRSGAMAWAFSLYGFEVYLLAGGYKTYRRHVLNTFTKRYNINVLGGMTGSGKTDVLHELSKQGNQVIDLEELAQHKGSSYGSLGKLVQPSQEQFENDLATQLNQLNQQDRLWLEDESQTIGKCFLPKPLWLQMREADVIKLDIPLQERIRYLAGQYGRLDKDFLITSTERIGRRLGPEQTRDALLAIDEDRFEDFARIVLVYYDKTYRTGLSKRNPDTIHIAACQNTNAKQNAEHVVNAAGRHAFTNHQ